MVPGTTPKISGSTTLDNFEARSAEKIFFSWYQNFQSGTPFYLCSISYNQFQSLNLPSSWILLLNFSNYVANIHDLVPVSPGLLTAPLPLVLVSSMYVPGTTVPQTFHLYLGSLEALYDLLPEPPVSTEIDKKRRTLGKLFWPEKGFSPGFY